MDEQTHTYNLKAVVMETGLKPVTLRAWERRYGLPQPMRTEGGHRLYSQRDIDMLKWLIARQKEGISISRAVALWNSLEEDGQDPIGAASPMSGVASPMLMPEGDSDLITEMRNAWIKSCLEFDGGQVERIMTQAFAQFPAEVVCQSILQKGLAQIGMGWYQGTVTVQQEHFASAQAMRRMEMLVTALPPPTRPERILVGCAPKDTHTFSTLLLTFLLRRYGWDVIYLGADVPIEQLGDTIEATEPDLVIFTVQQLHTAVSLLDIAPVTSEHEVALAYGGLALLRFPDLKNKIPGYFLGDEILAAPNRVQKIFIEELERGEGEPLTDRYLRARERYRKERAAIEAHIWSDFIAAGFPAELLIEINSYFGNDISAALRFGDINLVEADLEWLTVLVDNHGWPQEWVGTYLRAYHQAAVVLLDDLQHPLVVWLGEKAAVGS